VVGVTKSAHAIPKITVSHPCLSRSPPQHASSWAAIADSAETTLERAARPPPGCRRGPDVAVLVVSAAEGYIQFLGQTSY
jgi:hypothetical protein